MDDKLNNELCIDLVCEYGSGTTISKDTGYCDVICGDQYVGDGEQCDDGNLYNDDGCSSSCKI